MINDNTQITRRRFTQALTFIALSKLSTTSPIVTENSATLAVSNRNWHANNAATISNNGQISKLTFGDAGPEADNVIQVNYEELDNLPIDIDFELWLRGTDEGDGNWSGDADETGWEMLVSGSDKISDYNNEITYSWEEIFGEPTPLNVTDHSEIEFEDFEAPEPPMTREQVLEVEIRALIPSENDVSATATANAMISVSYAATSESLNLYNNSATNLTVRNPAGNSANNNQQVARWTPREESIESIDLRGQGGSRPTYRTSPSGQISQPVVEFSGTRHLITRANDGTNLGTNLQRNNTPKQASIFWVFQPRSSITTGDREVVRLYQNDSNVIRYQRNPGLVTVVLQGIQRTIEVMTPANSAYLLSLRFSREGDNVLLEARRNGSQIASAQNFGDVVLPEQPVVRIGSPNNTAGFNMLFAALRIYHTGRGSDIQEIESTMMDAWDIN